MPTENAITDDQAHEDDPVVVSAKTVIKNYLEANSHAYRELQQLREQGWQSSKGDQFFAKQQRVADNTSEKTDRHMNKMMKNIAREMQRATKAFTPELQTAPKHILDLCMAPGTYLAEALKHCPTAHAVAFTLPPEQGGLVPIMTESETVKIHKLDITMLAADMGLSPGEIDPSHPDAANFIHSRYLDDGRAFDLAICDGATRRTHERAAYRFYREGRRLLLTQLVLGLEHLRPGGSMIVLLHKLERPTTIRLLRVFHGFASAVLFKPKSGHATRSSFYMIASNVRSSDREAVEAVQEWKRDWKVSTVGTDEEWREDHARVAGFGELGIQGVLEEFGPTLVKLGQRVWKTQADGLKGASFMKK